MATDFPPAGATIVDVGLGHDGIRAVGYIQAGTAACPHRTTAVMWESTDGLEWIQILVDVVSNSAMSVFVESPNQMAIGRSGTPGCPGDGVAVWGPTDKADWYRDSALGYEPGDVVVDAVIADADGRVVATGWSRDGDGAAWTTTSNFFNIGRWEPANAPPRGWDSPLVALATTGQVVVGWDGSSLAPAWFSADEGKTWANSEFRAPFWFSAADATYASQKLFAAGSGCCALPNVRTGVVLSSLDGRSWSAAGSQILRSVPETIISTRHGLLALGAETYISSDGNDWTIGPPLPGYNGERLFAAILDDTLVITSPTQTWIATAADLKAQDWPIQASSPERPVVGETYSFRLATACGPDKAPVHFDLRTWVPDEASLPNGDWPRSFDNDEDWGSLTFVEENILEFTGDNFGSTPGTVVRFVPTDNPPEHRRCD